jgi:hypothetical protein
MPDWYEGLKFDFQQRWEDSLVEGQLPDALYLALRESLSEDLDVDLVHALNYDDDRQAFVMVKGDEGALVVHFEPPGKTTVSFFGHLTGGTYTETVLLIGEKGSSHIEAVFSHERLGVDGPLRVLVDLRPPARFSHRSPQEQDARDRTEKFRQIFRQWATEQPRPLT